MPKKPSKMYILTSNGAENLRACVSSYLLRRLPQAIPAPYSADEIAKQLFSDQFNRFMEDMQSQDWRARNGAKATHLSFAASIPVRLGPLPSSPVITLRSKLRVPKPVSSGVEFEMLDDTIRPAMLAWHHTAAECAREIESIAEDAVSIGKQLVWPTRYAIKERPPIWPLVAAAWEPFYSAIDSTMASAKLTPLTREHKELGKKLRLQLYGLDLEIIARVEGAFARAELVPTPAHPPIWINYEV